MKTIKELNQFKELYEKIENKLELKEFLELLKNALKHGWVKEVEPKFFSFLGDDKKYDFFEIYDIFKKGKQDISYLNRLLSKRGAILTEKGCRLDMDYFEVEYMFSDLIKSWLKD